MITRPLAHLADLISAADPNSLRAAASALRLLARELEDRAAAADRPARLADHHTRLSSIPERHARQLAAGIAPADALAAVAADLALPIETVQWAVKRAHAERAAADRRARDRKIARRAARGMADADIARLAGLSVSHTRRIIRRQFRAPD